MAKTSPTKIMAKLTEISDAWEDIAPSESFGAMTLAEFQTEIEKSRTLRDEITDLENQLTNKIQERDAADAETWKKAQFVVNSVAGNPNYGKNSGLYEAMGYVSTDRRRSGLTRKKNGGGGDTS